MHSCAFSGFRISALRASTWTLHIIFWNFHSALLRSSSHSCIFVVPFWDGLCQTDRQTETTRKISNRVRTTNSDKGFIQNQQSLKHLRENNLYYTSGLDLENTMYGTYGNLTVRFYRSDTFYRVNTNKTKHERNRHSDRRVNSRKRFQQPDAVPFTTRSKSHDPKLALPF